MHSGDYVAMNTSSALPLRGSTTEPNTPTPEPEPDSKPEVEANATKEAISSRPVLQYDFAYLIPTTAPTRAAIQRAQVRGDDYHRTFITQIEFNGLMTPCFVLRLGPVLQYPQNGWRIGKGREYALPHGAPLKDSHKHRGVDLLLDTGDADQDHGFAGIHARFSWAKGAVGFFLVASGNSCILNGMAFSDDRRTIPFANMIQLGEYVFSLKYIERSPAEEERFQVDLELFMRRMLDDQTPVILPTPKESNTRLGEWTVHRAMARGTFGIVYMVTNTSGRIAAAKQLLKTKHNAKVVDTEINMTRRIQAFNHQRLLTPFDIKHVKCKSDIEVKRIRSLLDETWDPEAFGNITDEYTIFMPYHNATLRSLITSDVSHSQRQTFFAKIIQGIAFLHANGFAHRDMKPENILIRTYDPPEPVITDYGSMSDRKINSYDSPGTISYLAPEQRHGRLHGQAVDCWACGLIGWELLTKQSLHQRVEVGRQLDILHRDLDARLREGSEMTACSRIMLEPDPDLRMTADHACRMLTKAGVLIVEDNGHDDILEPKISKRMKASASR